MPETAQHVLASWTIPIPFTLATVLFGILYLRGWRHIRLATANTIPAWRAASFLVGVFLIWLAIGSPLALFDEDLLTVHMVQHLLLMTIAPALILMGAPVMPMLHGLPQRFVQSVVGPVFRWQPLQFIGRVVSQPAVCWLAAAAALVGWHIPAAFSLALQSEGWHIVEHSSFLVAGFLFWWPVVQPWPSVPVWPRWSILLYLFAATLPCDILSAYLTFCDRVVYPAYLSTPRLFGLSALEDQECAGALMWACVTIVFLVPAAGTTMRLLAPNPEAYGFGKGGFVRASSKSSGTSQEA
ncbi:MAG TPA: cytochrome c oxidase assembly protein [Candidatus Acidoferrales bacterium]|jgi:putative membrane protein|nr:cytochrome c oxidase assembly protein [Candidatus Acidoferrales bacterium]